MVLLNTLLVRVKYSLKKSKMSVYKINISQELHIALFFEQLSIRTNVRKSNRMIRNGVKMR